MVKHQVFFSFEYNVDNWRASQIKQMGVVDDSSTFSSNEWEKVKRNSDSAIKQWIDSQMAQRSCCVVLVGTTTYTRKWVDYEIQHAMDLHKGIVGVYLHGLKDINGKQAWKGKNPFDLFFTTENNFLSDYVQCYDSPAIISSDVYRDIEQKLPDLIQDAIDSRFDY